MGKNISHFTTIDLSGLPGNIQQELYDFYIFLLNKYGNNKIKHPKKSIGYNKKFSQFLSSSIKTNDYLALNRDERNAR
jgi:hypothetical protein